MKRIGLLIILIIVLVSLSWFRVLTAQDLSQLSQEDRERLMNRLREQPAASQDPTAYRTPPLFEDSKAECSPRTPRNDSLDFRLDVDPESIIPELGEGEEAEEKPIDFDLVPFERLRPFGLEFFAPNSEAVPPSEIAAADDYTLGPGDRVVLYLWGRVEKQYELTVDREGKVVIPTVGELSAHGLTLDEFRRQAKRRFGAFYSEFELTCSLGRIRTIRIYVTGEVIRPGAYTVSSLTSLFNALTFAGGPNDRGSLRRIKLMRRGRCVEEVDLYQLLLHGDNGTDVRLESGDVVFVPVVGAQVAVRGEVRREAVYELLGGETARKILSLAGEPTAEAYLNRVMMERISGGEQWEVRDLDLSPNAKDSDNIAMSDGDRLTVYSIFEAKRNMVGVFGWVEHPGHYERNDSTRVSHLLAQAQLPDYDVFYDRADLFRRHADARLEIIPLDLHAIVAGDSMADPLVADRDSIHVYPVDEISWEKRVYIEGEVKKPGWYPLYDGMSVADLIFLAGSFKRSADQSQAELARPGQGDGVDVNYVPLDNGEGSHMLLREDDHLFVRRLPHYRTERTVTLSGQVRYPGTYVLRSESETLYQLLHRAGGFVENAFPEGLVLERPSIEDGLNRLNVGELLERSRGVKVDSVGQIQREEVFDYDLSSMNRIIIQVDKMLATKGRKGDVVLQPGDRITVPSIPTGISVMGSVGANGTLGYRPGRKVKEYIKRAGGFTRRADKREVRLIRADGEVLSGGVLGEIARLGDIVVVPTKVERSRDWGKAISTTLSVATGLLTSIYIVSKL